MVSGGEAGFIGGQIAVCKIEKPPRFKLDVNEVNWQNRACLTSIDLMRASQFSPRRREVLLWLS